MICKTCTWYVNTCIERSSALLLWAMHSIVYLFSLYVSDVISECWNSKRVWKVKTKQNSSPGSVSQSHTAHAVEVFTSVPSTYRSVSRQNISAWYAFAWAGLSSSGSAQYGRLVKLERQVMVVYQLFRYNDCFLRDTAGMSVVLSRLYSLSGKK